MPVVVTAVFTPVEGRRAELVHALRETMPGVHAERGCELYAIHDADDGTITMLEKWTTQEDLDRHANGHPVKALQAATADLIAVPVAVTTMAPLPAGTRDQGEL